MTSIVNSLRWQEGTEITVDSEVETPATGWTFGYLSVFRLGDLVAVHLEATSDGSGTGEVCALPSDFAPASTVTSSDGAFTIDPDGTVTCVAGGGAGTSLLDVNYAAAVASP